MGTGGRSMKDFRKGVKQYLSGREQLSSVLALVDCEVGLGPEDFEALDLLSTVRDEIAGTEAPYWIILTKCDSLSPELLAASYHCIQQDLKKYGKDQADLPMVSSSLFVGIAELWDRMHTGVRDHIDNHDPAVGDWEIEYEDDVKEAKKAIDEVSALKVPELKQRLKDARTALVPAEEARLAEADKP